MNSEPPMRVAMFHTRYTQPGGEDLSTEQEVKLLRRKGVPVFTFYTTNEEALKGGITAAARTLWGSSFNRWVYDEVREFCRRYRPSVAHVQNFWFALSPSVHRACHDEGVATVQTLRNYRLLCVNGMLLRKGNPCEICVGRAPWPGVALACYRNSRLSSALVARMIISNRVRQTWNRDVDVLVALTDFAKRQFVAGGLPADKILVKPNFVEDPGPPATLDPSGVFLGRLSHEKGVDIILEAWKGLSGVPLHILGDGPEAARVRRAAKRMPTVRWHGHQPTERAHEVLQRSGFVVMASRWYEGFPRVLIEAMAAGRPAVVPRLGSMAEVVEDGRTGLLFCPGDPTDLTRKVLLLVNNPELLRRMGREARRRYELRYSEHEAYQQTIRVYRHALESFRHSSSKS